MERHLVGALEPRVGRVRALAAVSVAFGYIQHALVQETLAPVEEIVAVMRQTLGELPAR